MSICALSFSGKGFRAGFIRCFKASSTALPGEQPVYGTFRISIHCRVSSKKFDPCRTSHLSLPSQYRRIQIYSLNPEGHAWGTIPSRNHSSRMAVMDTSVQNMPGSTSPAQGFQVTTSETFRRMFGGLSSPGITTSTIRRRFSSSPICSNPTSSSTTRPAFSTRHGD